MSLAHELRRRILIFEHEEKNKVFAKSCTHLALPEVAFFKAAQDIAYLSTFKTHILVGAKKPVKKGAFHLTLDH